MTAHSRPGQESHRSQGTLVNLWQSCPQLDWWRVGFTGIQPVLALVIGVIWVPLKFQTALFTIVYMTMSGLGITAGYHRLWAHRAYSAHPILQATLAICGASAGQGSIRTWCRDHRAHHRYVDTDRDPYSISKGFFYAHYGWVIFRRQPNTTGRVDIQDLTGNSLVMWQRKYYLPLIIFTVYIIPTFVCGLFFDDFAGGFIYASCLRVFTIQQATFCVNSLAHWVGDKPYSDRHSPRNNTLVALITWGEGYHNFHHEFPTDYRNGYRWMHWDPTKWLIWVCATLHLAFDLRRFPKNEIDKGHFQQVVRNMENKRQKLSWGIPIHELPVISHEKFSEYVKDGRTLILVDGIAHDVKNFMSQHPGGSSILDINAGKDCTGMLYAHSNAAINYCPLCGLQGWKILLADALKLGNRLLVARSGKPHECPLLLGSVGLAATTLGTEGAIESSPAVADPCKQ